MGNYVKVSYNRICAYCGKEFVAHNKKREYCSHKCRDIAIRVRKGINCNTNTEPYHKICVVCGKPFDTFRDAIITCSPECSKEYKIGAYRNIKKEFVCSICGSIYMSARKQSKTCGSKSCVNEYRKRAQKIRNERYKEKKKLIAKTELRICAVCKRPFSVDSRLSTKTCSHDCSNEWKRINRNTRHDKRIPKGSRIDNITLNKLYRRDKGKCYLCHGVCNWSDWRTSNSGYKYPGDTYPTIDHVIPVSKGGYDSWDNVRLACWKCNMEKSDSVLNIKSIDKALAYSENRRGTQSKKTAQYTLDGKLIKIWESTAEIKKKLGLNDKHIQNVCRKDKSKTGNAYGFHWEYLGETNDRCG